METKSPSSLSAGDRSHDVWQARPHPLDAIFQPKSVAVIGASERAQSVGRTILWNLIGNPFGGTVYPVNPNRHSILGIRAYPTIASVPEPIDLAVIATPAPTVPDIVAACAAAGVKGGIIISAGFKEIGAAGIALERAILDRIGNSGMRLIGPNCLGAMNPFSGLNATFASSMARPGSVAFISQSGALCTAILDWSFGENVGFSAFVSTGSMLDVGWGDLIEYFGDDPRTKAIAIYMESIGNARAFLSAAREVALSKPIVVLKAGQTDVAARAAASHTGALAGSDEVLNAAFRRCGVLRVHTIEDLFNMTEVLAKQPPPKGKRAIVLTNAGGPGVLVTDALIGGGGELPELSPETRDRLNEVLPPHWSHHNPIDILGDADSDRYAKALEIAAKDPNADGLLVILTPQAMTDPTHTAEKLKPLARLEGKPVLASWMGGADVEAGSRILKQAGIPTFAYPDAAARTFNYMWQYAYNLRGLYETPHLPHQRDPDRERAKQIVETTRATGRTLLTEQEAKELLAAYGIPVVPTAVATCEEAAVAIADRIGYPVVLKLHSETITHKTDVGGVRLNLPDAETVRRAYRAIAESVARYAATHPEVGDRPFLGVTVQPMLHVEGYELILGASLDPQFGPVLLFGTGGQLVEVFRDRALALPPLNSTLARRMMEQTRIYKALQGVRGRAPVDLEALEDVLVRFSQLVVELDAVCELDINPLLVSSDRIVALDARIVLASAGTARSPQPAIRPYPMQYVAPWTMKLGDTVTIRPIRPEDEPGLVAFHRTLSEESVYLRYAQALKLSRRIAHERLTRICYIDYDCEMVLVAETTATEDTPAEIAAVGRLSKVHGTNGAEFAMLVSDRYQCQGLGSELLRRLLQVAKDEHLDFVEAYMLAENGAMRHVCERLGFRLERVPGEAMLHAIFAVEQ